MSELAKLDERVTRLEREMGDVRKLAASASAEVGDVHARLRAHTKSLEALRKTQVEQGQEMRAGFAAIDQRFASLTGEMNGRFATLEGEMREGFAKVGVGMAQINALLKIVIDQSDDES